MGWTVFDQHAVEYDRWFDEHGQLYQAEVNALSRFIPPAGLGVEIGVGTGRFAVPFGIRLGVEPSRRMAQIVRGRDIGVCQGVGERLPFRDGQFDFVLLVTVICFVEDVSDLLREARRVLRSDGRLILGFIDRNSALGRVYESRKETDQFYRHARFYAAAQVADHTRQAGFDRIAFCQTIFGLPGKTSDIEPVRAGYGEGAFVALSAEKIQ
jgi:SAM-dependent methyltransferase